MNRLQATIAATVCAVLMSGSAVFAQQTPRRVPAPTASGRPGFTATPGAARTATAPAKASPQEKAASDNFMKEGIAQLQAASAAMQSGHPGQASLDVQAGMRAFQKGNGIYAGHRDHAMMSTAAAMHYFKVHDNAKVEPLIEQAIKQAQAALSVN